MDRTGPLETAFAALLAGALLLGALPAPAGAQNPQPEALPVGAVLLLDDPASDVAAFAPMLAPPTEMSGSSDLLWLYAQEFPRTVAFTFAVASLTDTGTQAGQDGQYSISFLHGRANITISVYRDFPHGSGGDEFGADVRSQTRTGSGSSVVFYGDVPVQADVEAGTVRVEVPREYLLDEKERAPRAGSEFTAFLARAFSPTQQSDQMPDAGAGRIPLRLGLGAESTGHARLSSDEPYRVSNGEASTFVFKVNATNRGEAADTFSLKAEGVPPGWDVRLPASVLRLEAKQAVALQVVVRTAFTHDHGSSDLFRLVLQSQSTPDATARLEAGLLYLAIPQPAGHHNQLWLHSRDTGALTDQLNYGLNEALAGSGERGEAYMNTAENDQGDEDVAVGGLQCTQTIGVTSSHCWTIPLEPELQIGLDFDMDGEGTLDVAFRSQLPLPNARLSGTLEYVGPAVPGDVFGDLQDRFVVANVSSDTPVEFGPNGEGTFTARITPAPDGDYVAYDGSSGLELNLVLVSDRPDNFFLGPRLPEPELLPGGQMTLPLLEYEDRFRDLFALTSGIVLEADDGERFVNPGETVLYHVELSNTAAFSEDLRLSLIGSNLDWGRVLTGDRAHVGARGNATVSVAVTAPVDARDGDRADLILEAASTQDINARALVRLLTTVDTEEDHPDQSEEAGLIQPKGEDSPGLPTVGVVAALGLAGVAMAMRRSRR